jgi:alpha-L-fucosidase 2
MLLQSQNGELQLLPALPAAWKSGSVRGLRARGGFLVDIAWADGRLVQATVRSVAGAGGATLRYGDRIVQLPLAPGQSRRVGPDLKDIR